MASIAAVKTLFVLKKKIERQVSVNFIRSAYISIQIVHIKVCFTHAMLWVAAARHNFKWVKTMYNHNKVDLLIIDN